MKKQYGIYEVSESFREDGLWQGYTVRCVDSNKKQGKLYIKSDGRENYQEKKTTEISNYEDLFLHTHEQIKDGKEKPNDEELEI